MPCPAPRSARSRAGATSPVAVLVAVPVTVLSLVLTGCGFGGLGGPGDPEPVAVAFQEAWVGGDCESAMEYVDEPDDAWRSSCRDAFAFSLACEELQGSGDPRSEECGPGTRIKVLSGRARTTTYADDEAIVSVAVTYERGTNSRRQKIRKIVLREVDGAWKVTKTS